MRDPRDIIRDTASTLAHLWCGDDSRDQQGVTRIIRSYSEALGPVLCAHIMRYLEERCPEKAVTFEAMLLEEAEVTDEV